MLGYWPVIWYRESCIEHEKNEFEAMSKYFECVNSRVKIKPNQLVISRYSCLPYYEEQAYDIQEIGATLINSYKQHKYVADLRLWYEDLNAVDKTLTPKTWTGLDWIDEDGPYVLKGTTNSRKQRWKSHMYAKDLKAAKEVYWELTNDPLFQDTKQDIVIRKYHKLFKYFDGITGMPVTKEFRFFILNGTIISGGYYWGQYIDDLPVVPDINEVPKEFLEKVIKIVGNKINFWILDVGQEENGNWIVIELGDSQMAGLSCNDPFVLYENLAKKLKTASLSW